VSILRFVRIAEIRSKVAAGHEYESKLEEMSRRVENPDIVSVQLELSKALTDMRSAESEVLKRAGKVWESRVQSEDDIVSLLDEIVGLISAFEGCSNDLEDFRLLQRTLRMYQDMYRQLADDSLTWKELKDRSQLLMQRAEEEVGESEVPWLPKETLGSLLDSISKRRKQASQEWIGEIEAETTRVSKMSASEAGRLHERASNSPAFLNDQDSKRLKKAVSTIERRLSTLKIEWMVEKFRELSAAERGEFLSRIKKSPDK